MVASLLRDCWSNLCSSLVAKFDMGGYSREILNIEEYVVIAFDTYPVAFNLGYFNPKSVNDLSLVI